VLEACWTDWSSVDDLPLEHGSVSTPGRQQSTVVVEELNVGHVTAVSGKHVTRRLATHSRHIQRYGHRLDKRRCVPGFVQTLKHCFPELSRTCKDKFQSFPGLNNAFSRTFQDTFRSQTWLHKVKKCTYQISFRCNCITVNKPKCNTCGDKMHTMYYNEFLL